MNNEAEEISATITEVEEISSDLNELLARKAIPDLVLRPLRISGVEVTQAIQYYHASSHLTDPSDRGPDNSVQLVAYKPAWVRVYVRGLFHSILNVSGTVEVQRRNFGIIYLPVLTLSPQPPGNVVAPVFSNYATQRGNIGNTLNFIIPAEYMVGHIRLKVRVSGGSYSHNTNVYLDLTLCQTLRLAGIMIGYNGSNGAPTNPTNIVLPAPTLQDLQSTAPYTLTTMPVQSNATYRVAGTVTWTRPLTDAPLCPGCCSQNWIDLNNAVQQVRINDGNRTDVIYYGLMANGIPMGPIIGCNSSGVSASTVGGQVTMAHEIGHYLGLDHAPCGLSGPTVDPNYPAYEPYDPVNTPTASIGEYGLNINNGNILNPQTYKDFMSYCAPKWISLYHYGKLINTPLLDPIRVGEDEPWFSEYVTIDPNIIPEKWLPDPPPDPLLNGRVKVNPVPLISLIGIIKSDKELEVRSVSRLDAFRDVTGSERTEFVAELIDKDEKVVASAPVYRLASYSHTRSGCDCSHSDEPSCPPYLFQAFLDNVATGTELRIRRGEDKIWVRQASSAPPIINKFNAHVRKERILYVNWDIESKSQQETEVWLQWYSDKEKSWRGLATGLLGKDAELDTSILPSGSISLRLLAHDGYFTSVSDKISVRIPTRPPSIAIMSPREDSEIIANSTFRLWGSATAGSGKPIDMTSVRWLIDNKEVARGLDTYATSPSQGQHRCTLIVDADGKKAERSIKFRTISIPSEGKSTKSKKR